jgi:hypothetical protein
VPAIDGQGFPLALYDRAFGVELLTFGAEFGADAAEESRDGERSALSIGVPALH